MFVGLPYASWDGPGASSDDLGAVLGSAGVFVRLGAVFGHHGVALGRAEKREG